MATKKSNLLSEVNLWWNGLSHKETLCTASDSFTLVRGTVEILATFKRPATCYLLLRFIEFSQGEQYCISLEGRSNPLEHKCAWGGHYRFWFEPLDWNTMAQTICKESMYGAFSLEVRFFSWNGMIYVINTLYSNR